MSQDKKDIANWNYVQETISLKETIEKSFLALGERLLRIRNSSLYAPTYDSFKDFLSEMGMSESTASRLIGIYEKYIVLGRLKPESLISPRGWDNLSKFLPYIKTKEDAENFATKAITLSREDALKEAYELRTGVPMAECEHENQYKISICRDCGLKTQIYDEEI